MAATAGSALINGLRIHKLEQDLLEKRHFDHIIFDELVTCLEQTNQRIDSIRYTIGADFSQEAKIKKHHEKHQV